MSILKILKIEKKIGNKVKRNHKQLYLKLNKNIDCVERG
jgi:hypothetical protein